jgi:uncharacterized protein
VFFAGRVGEPRIFPEEIRMRISTFVLKVASRCNLNCEYCYVYNRADTQWKRQPKFMSIEVAERTGRVIRDYCDRRAITNVNVQFHGGEPLMLGTQKLGALIDAVRGGMGDSAVAVSSALQTNGLLLTDDVLKMLHGKGVGLYVSCDGPASASDDFRIDHQDRPVSAKLHDKLELLARSPYRDIFQGFLCVINPYSDPAEVFRYLSGFEPKAVDFLLPLENHDTPDFGQTRTLYGRWLTQCFNAWVSSSIKVRSRIFERIVHAQIVGHKAALDTASDGLVIECDGSFEADDTLKTTYDGASALGLDVFRHSVEEVLVSPTLQVLSAEAEPPETCRNCDYFHSCGGGHLTHRYAVANRFDNPSVYCEQNKQLIDHVTHTLIQLEQSQNQKETAVV